MSAHLLLLTIIFNKAAAGTVIPEGTPGLRAGGRERKLISFGQRNGHIWGRCDRWNRDMTGCNLQDAFKCSSRISAGPADGDVEIRIGGLPPSREQQEVHVQWWAPRKSPSSYDPLKSPINSAIYRRVFDAYPQYSDAEFNGGNIKVNEHGEAIVKVRHPSSYQMYQWIAFPHIHLRLCTNESFVHDRRDAIFFTMQGPYISSGCNSNDIPYQILAYRYVNQDWTSFAGQVQIPQVTTTTEQVEITTTTPPTTTEATTTAEPVILVDLRLQSAKEALDLDALEFSPVYQCFLENLFFDQFSSDCVEDCPGHADIEHGQCVRKEVRDTPVTITASWKLQVECGQACWEEKKNVTLHHLRLAVADHLDVPFQEVFRVDLDLLNERRLAQGSDQAKVAKLSVHVSSRRIAVHAELDNLIDGKADASQLLGLTVHGVEQLEAATVKDDLAPTPKQDPYQSAYEAAEKKQSGVAVAGTPISTLPLPQEAIFGIAGAVILLFAAFFLMMLVRRRRAAAAAAPPSITVEGEKVEDFNATDVVKTAAQIDEPPQFDVPTTPEVEGIART